MNTPPMSDRGSIAQPFSLEDRVQSLDMEDPPFPDVVRCLSLVVAGHVD